MIKLPQQDGKEDICIRAPNATGKIIKILSSSAHCYENKKERKTNFGNVFFVYYNKCHGDCDMNQ